MKLCRGCGTIKALTEFHKRSQSGKPRARCKVCNYAQNECNNRKRGIKKRTKMSPEQKRESLRKASAKHNKTAGRKTKQAQTEATRRAKKLKATPKWLSETQLDHIAAYYEAATMMAQLTGIQWDVDHIVPLKGKNVSGLHVPWNMQVMEHQQNCLKSNKYG